MNRINTDKTKPLYLKRRSINGLNIIHLYLFDLSAFIQFIPVPNAYPGFMAIAPEELRLIADRYRDVSADDSLNC